LGAGWRGSVVDVCRGRACTTVRLIDWCACGGGRVIDLYADAFDDLAPLGRGVISVTVRRHGSAVRPAPTLPPTDTEPISRIEVLRLRGTPVHGA
jgi:rare lipoprotein A (peptidoglycan hydrolase)